MAKKSVLFSIHEDLVNALKGVIETKYIFLKDRPSSIDSDTPMKKFVVIDLPVSINDYVIGKKKTYLTTAGVIYLFTATTKKNTLDINATGNLVDSIVELFPINGQFCSAADPVVRMTGNDGQGFQVTTITFDLQTKWRVFDKE